MKILITSVGTATAVNLIRYFKKDGHEIIGVDINDYGYTAGSLLVDSYARVPYATDETYVDVLAGLIVQYNADILIPINDSEVYRLSQNLSKIPCRCLIPSVDVIELFRDKLTSTQAISELGIPVPEILNEDRPEIKRILRDRVGVGSKGIWILNENEPAPDYSSEQMLQVFVAGEEYTIDVLADSEGNAAFIIPRIRLEVKNGQSTKAVLVQDEQLIQYAKTIVSTYRIPGFCNIQFIKDSLGVYRFVELNYRFSGCGSASLIATDGYLKQFVLFSQGEKACGTLNESVKWNSIVTRYYEEVLYEKGFS